MATVDQALAIAGVALSLPSLAQQVLQLGELVVQTYASFRNAEDEANVQKIEFNLYWSQLQRDISFVRRSSENFTPDVRDSLEALLFMLKNDFRAAIEVFSYASGPDGKIKPGRWALEFKRTLENLVRSIEKWQSKFTHYILLLNLTGHESQETEANVDRALEQPWVERISRRLKSAITEGQSNTDKLCMLALPVGDDDLDPIPHSLLKMPKASAHRRDFVVESRHYERTDDPNYVKHIVGYTAQILSASDARPMHMLSCQGYTHRENLRRFDIMLNFPSGMGSPRTVRDLLLDTDFPEPSLSSRLLLCKQIATAALYIHAATLVHKSIRPENILTLHQMPMTATTAGFDSLGSPFLVGFENVRNETHDWKSSLRVDNSWERNLYSHPTRQGRPTAKYTMAHDVYSIGVVLYEIGLWRCFLTWDDRNLDYTIDEQVLPGGRTILRKLREMRPGAGEELKRLYERLASNDLPNVMGDRFTQVVLKCLSAVEDDLAEETGAEGVVGTEGDENIRKAAEREGLRYIQTILDAFEDIRM